MKNSFKLLILALLSLVSLGASAQKTVTLNIDNPDGVVVKAGYSALGGLTDPYTLVAGNNTVEIPAWKGLVFIPVDGYSFTVLSNGVEKATDKTETYFREEDVIKDDDIITVKVKSLSAAKDSRFTINIDNPDNVYVGKTEYGGSFGTLTAGNNEIEFASGDITAIYVRDETYTSGATFTCTLNGTALTKYESGMAFYKILTTVQNGDVLTIVTGNGGGAVVDPEPEEVTCSLTVNVDDVTKVAVLGKDAYGNLTSLGTLSNGSNTVTYTQGAYESVVVRDPNYTVLEFYSVTLNDVAVSRNTSQGYAYYETTGMPADGARLDITANFPVKPVVTFTFQCEDAESTINSVISYLKIGDVIRQTEDKYLLDPVTLTYTSTLDPTYNASVASSYEANHGDQLEIRFEGTLYDISSVTINGTPLSNAAYTTIVNGDIDVVVNVTKYTTYEATIVADDITKFTAYRYGTQADANLITLVNGENVLTFKSDLTSILFVPAEDMTITSISDGTKTYGPCYQPEGISIPISEGKTLTVNTGQAQFATVNVDDASKVKLMDSSYQYVTLSNGANTNIPAGTYMIQPNASGYLIKEVTKNSSTVTPEYGYYQVTLAKGDVLNITACYDEITYPVTVTPEGIVTGIYIGSNSVEGASSFDAAAGYQVTLVLDGDNYNIKGITVNGEAVSTGTSVSFYATQATTVAVNAADWGYSTVNLNVASADAVTVYQGTQYAYQESNVLTVTADKTVSVSEKFGYIHIKKNTGFDITSVSVGGVEYTANYYGVYVIPVTNGMTVDITSAAIVRDQKATVIIDDKSKADYSFSFQRSDRSEVEMATGTNEVLFSTDDNTFSFSAYGSNLSEVLVWKNGSFVSPQYQGSSSYSLSFVNGDKVIIYLKGAAYANHDVNRDGQVSIADVTDIANFILTEDASKHAHK